MCKEIFNRRFDGKLTMLLSLFKILTRQKRYISPVFIVVCLSMLNSLRFILKSTGVTDQTTIDRLFAMNAGGGWLIWKILNHDCAVAGPLIQPTRLFNVVNWAF